MIPILYEANEKNFVTNGVCRLPDCISCVVTEERNGIYEVDFEYPITGQNYNKITLGRVIAVTHDEGGDIQPFDIVSCTRPINGIVKFHGVHISYRLNKWYMMWYWWGNIEYILHIGLINYESTPDFTFDTDIPGRGEDHTRPCPPMTVRQFMGGMEGSLLDQHPGSEWEFDKYKCFLHSARGKLVDFSIMYGLNMVDYSEDIDYSNVYTRVRPYWVGQDDQVVIADETSCGKKMYNGITHCVPLDLTNQFEGKPTRAQLRTAAREYMLNNKTYLPAQNITVDFIRLQDSEEYAQFERLMDCKLCDRVRVVFPEYGTDEIFKIVRTEWNVLKDRFDKMELGDLQTTLAEALGINNGSNQKGIEIVTEQAVIISTAGRSIPSGSYWSDSKTITKPGYMPLGIVGHTFTGDNRTWMINPIERLSAISEGSCTVTFTLRNMSTNTWAGSYGVDIQWMKI